MSLLQFITAIPWDVYRGTGCYVGTSTLVQALRQLGIDVALVTPQMTTSMFTATRVLFNESLRWRHFSGDATVGIDADGYSLAGRAAGLPHIACIEGVLVMRFASNEVSRGRAWRSRHTSKQKMPAAPPG